METPKHCNLYFKTFCLLFIVLFYACKENVSSDSAHAFTNDLIHETSPYLLQHAHNPVNWKAWDDTILEEAKKENKLILISIGYSSCHWCHVMEEETFEDAEVAKLMNENFINIKVDREERPDIDQVYQTASVLQGQNGGWPLNAITLPNGKPLYLGTYHTKSQWMEVLTAMYESYNKDPEKATKYSDMLAAGIEEASMFKPSSEFEKLTPEVLKTGVDTWSQKWDLELGGNKGREKFPVPNVMNFLLDYALLNEDESALKHLKKTLDQMASGGIYDHLGGGFYRYSTDPYWKVPHFEKMLYDNAQLIGLYSKAYTVFKEPRYKEVVFQTVAFLEREMKNEAGAYYATLDSESDGEEGKFYVWSAEELKSILGDDFSLFSKYYSIEKGNVWEEDNYILFTTNTEEEFLKSANISLKDFAALKTRWNKKLIKARNERVRPSTDDKIITSWNALLIDGFVAAYQAFEKNEFLEKAISIYDFIQLKSYSSGQLIHSFKENSKRNVGFLEDYTFLASASLSLYEATLDAKYLDFSNKLIKQAHTDFADASSGMFKFNKDQGLISNPIKTNDGDIPSPNSVMAHTLFQLGQINYNPQYSKQSKTMLTTMLPYVTEYTDSYANWSQLLLHVAHPYYEIAVVGPEADKLIANLQSESIPNTLIIGTTTDSDAPLFEDRFVDGKTYIYVCQDRVCKLPVETVEEALQQIENF